ncbi:hypothetical protein LSTR_LSTR006933 [Laodelphax striatellus]|uniref:Uncharacterized protein n=1 Tax=Laodelphax striatellus TaxID=195883 RepID=A0A482X3H8_LAOST|nr:hypothetical protein LSTR_LSTR006933 [Laodelphax striatellus]
MATGQGSRSFYRIESSNQTPNMASRSTREMFPSGAVNQSRHQCPHGLGNTGISPQRSHRRPCPVHHASRKSRVPSVSRELKLNKQKFPSEHDFPGITRQLQEMFTSKSYIQKQSKVEKVADLSDEIDLKNNEEHGFSNEKYLAAGEQAANNHEIPGKRRSMSLPNSSGRLLTPEGNQYETSSTHSRQTQMKPLTIPPSQDSQPPHNVPMANQRKEAYKETITPSKPNIKATSEESPPHIGPSTPFMNIQPHKRPDPEFINISPQGRTEYMNIPPQNRPESMKIPDYGGINPCEHAVYNSEYPMPVDNQGYVLENRKVAHMNDYFGGRRENWKLDHCYDSRNKNVNYKNEQYYNFEDKNQHLKVNPCQPPDSRNWNANYSRSFQDPRIGHNYVDPRTYHQYFNHFGNKNYDPRMHHQFPNVRVGHSQDFRRYNVNYQPFDPRAQQPSNLGDRNEYPRIDQCNSGSMQNVDPRIKHDYNWGGRNEIARGGEYHDYGNNNIETRTHQQSNDLEDRNEDSNTDHFGKSDVDPRKEQGYDYEDRNMNSKIEQSHDNGNKNVDCRTEESHDFKNRVGESKNRNEESETGQYKEFQDNSKSVEVMSSNFSTDKYHDFQSKNILGEPERVTTKQMTNNKENYAECSPEINPVCQEVTSDICQPETKTCPSVKVTDPDTNSVKKTRKPKMNVCLKLVKNKNGELSVIKDGSCGCCNH